MLHQALASVFALVLFPFLALVLALVFALVLALVLALVFCLNPPSPPFRLAPTCPILAPFKSSITSAAPQNP